MTSGTNGHAVPVFPVGDVRRALINYRDLGFTARIDDSGDYGYLRFGGIRLHVVSNQRLDKKFGLGFCYVFVDDADALAASWTSAGGAGTVVPPVDKPWNMREGLYTDIDGNIIRFGSRMRLA